MLNHRIFEHMKNNLTIILLSVFCLRTMDTSAQSITIDPSKSSTISTSRSTNYLDINKTGTTNFSGLRFLQNAAVQGGLYFNEDYNYFNLGNGPGTAGLVWNRGTQRVGVGTLSPTAKLQITGANSASNPHVLIQETASGVGGRISFENINVANKKWTLFAKNENGRLPGDNLFNIFHSDFGNIAQFDGDGLTKLNGNAEISGFTRLGEDAPKIKIRKLVGEVIDNNTQNIPLDLAFSKIINYDIVISSSYYVSSGLGGNMYHGLFKPGGGNPNGCNYNAYLSYLVLGYPENSSLHLRIDNIGNEIRNGGSQYIITIIYEE